MKTGSKKSEVSSDLGEWLVEKVVNKRYNRGRAEYYVKWKGFSSEKLPMCENIVVCDIVEVVGTRSSENTWEPAEHLKSCPYFVKEYEENKRGRKRKSSVSSAVSSSSTTSVPNSLTSSPPQSSKGKRFKDDDEDAVVPISVGQPNFQLSPQIKDEDFEGHSEDQSAKESKTELDFDESEIDWKRVKAVVGVNRNKITRKQVYDVELERLDHGDGDIQVVSVPSSIIQVRAPQLVIQFLANLITWVPEGYATVPKLSISRSRSPSVEL